MSINKSLAFVVHTVIDMTRKKMTVSLPETDLIGLRQYAEDSGRTLSGAIRKALKLLYEKEGFHGNAKCNQLATNSV